MKSISILAFRRSSRLAHVKGNDRRQAALHNGRAPRSSRRRPASPYRLRSPNRSGPLWRRGCIAGGRRIDDWLFPSRYRPGDRIAIRQDAGLANHWLVMIDLEQSADHTQSPRRTKVALIYRTTGNLRDRQLLLGHRKLQSTAPYPGMKWTTNWRCRSRPISRSLADPLAVQNSRLRGATSGEGRVLELCQCLFTALHCPTKRGLERATPPPGRRTT